MTHVLLLEPDRVLANLYRQKLESAGYRVTICRSAETAIHIADKHRPDIVVIELQLAGHNGVEFLYEFRSYPEWQGIPVIVLSRMMPDRAVPMSVRKTLQIAACLYKPQLKLSELVTVVSRSLDEVPLERI